jgi:hypothetical protein
VIRVSRAVPSNNRALRSAVVSGSLFGLLLAGGGCQELLNGLADGGADAGSAGGAGGGGTSMPGCGLPNEPEPNDTRERATPYTAGATAAGCMVSAEDVDFFEFTAPSGDAAGGYFQGALTDVGNGRVEARIFSASDNAPIDRSYTDDPGASLFFYFAAAPGQTYRVAVANLPPFTAGFPYTFKAAYSKIADGFEPNDTRDQAKPIGLGMTVSAFIFAGHTSSTVQSDEFKDWYSFTLGAGNVTIKVTDVPSNVRIEGFLYDADGSKVDAPRMSNDNYGGSFDVTTRVLKPGLHRLELGTYPPAPQPYGKGMTLPDNFTKPYKLTVSQP